MSTPRQPDDNQDRGDRRSYSEAERGGNIRHASDREDILTECDREPIHIPGRIQPHGLLIAIDQTGTIQYVSQTFLDQFDIAADECLGHQLGSVIPARSELSPVADDETGHTRFANPQTVTLADPESGTQSDWNVVPCPSENLTVLEFERHENSGPGIEHFLARNSRWLTGSHSTSSLIETCTAAARHVQDLTGFDRVMVYQFHPDGHGEVIAEELRDGMEPLLGLHYPASDIPKQARALYLRNWLRLIADVNAETSPVLSRSSQPLDLSWSHLRAVSPVHVEYLQNMGVRASMSLSIVVEGELWGLIACHHNSALMPSFPMRAGAEMIAIFLSSKITDLQNRVRAEARESTNQRIGKSLHHGPVDRDPVSRVEEHLPELMEMTGASGIVLSVGGRSMQAGDQPSADVLQSLQRAVSEAGEERGVVTDSLFESGWSSEISPDVSGAVCVSLSAVPGDLLGFFRPEFRSIVEWAGRPEKETSEGAEKIRLSPRLSFAKWEQERLGFCKPWTEADLEIIRSLRQAVQEMLAEHASRVDAINNVLRRSNEELEFFANAASHDLREPLRGIRYHIEAMRRGIADQEATDELGRHVDSAQDFATRMDQLIDTLLHYARVGWKEQGSPRCRLIEVIEEALMINESRRIETGANIDVEVDDVEIAAEFLLVREMLQNLIVNAMKYTRKTHPQITIRSELIAEKENRRKSVAIHVADDGIGVKESHIPHMFELFRRLNSDAKFSEGSGAGLAIVKRIVERYEGTIDVRSVLGEGTTFIIHLPRAGDD